MMARGSDKLVSAQIQPGISSCCPGDNFNNSRGAACPSATTAGPATGTPASQAGAGAAVGRAGPRHMPGSPPARNLERPAMRDGPSGAGGWPRIPDIPDARPWAPWKVAHPELPALHLHVALLDNVIEIGRHGFSSVSLRFVSLGRRGEGCPGGLGFPTPPTGLLRSCSSPRPPQHCSSSSFARRLLEIKMTGRLDSDIFLFPWLSRSFFPSSTHTRPLPSSLSPPFFLPFPPHPRTAEPFRKTRGGGLYKENGLAQSPPSHG